MLEEDGVVDEEEPEGGAVTDPEGTPGEVDEPPAAEVDDPSAEVLPDGMDPFPASIDFSRYAPAF